MSSHSRRSKPSTAETGRQSADASQQSAQGSNRKAILEAEAAQGSGGGFGAWLQRIFGGGQQRSGAGPQVMGASVLGGGQSQQGQRAVAVQTGLGAAIDQVVAESPTLANRVNEILANGWTIRWSQEGESGSFARRAEKLIGISRSNANNARRVAGTIAHEVGHAITPLERVSGSGTAADNNRVRAHLRNEAEAVVFNYETARETRNFFGFEDFGVRAPPGSERLFNQYLQGAISRSALIDGIAQLFAQASPSTNPDVNYVEWYSQYYRHADGNIDWGS